MYTYRDTDTDRQTDRQTDGRKYIQKARQAGRQRLYKYVCMNVSVYIIYTQTHTYIKNRVRV